MDRKDMSKHYIGMAGLHGCLPQYCQSHETIKDAVEDLAQLHELSERKRRVLRRDLYLEMDVYKDGNEYCEITELMGGYENDNLRD